MELPGVIRRLYRSTGIGRCLQARRVVTGMLVSALIATVVVAPARGASAPLSLTVAAGHGLYPSFHRDTRDYAMYDCGGKKVTLRFNRPVTVNGRKALTHTVAAKEHVATLLRLVDDGRSSQHTLRCLPKDFPRLNARPYVKDLNGYFLISPNGENISGYLILMDANGVPLWYRYPPDGLSPMTYRLTPSGEIEAHLTISSNEERNYRSSDNRNILLRVGFDGRLHRSVRPTENGQVIGTDHHGFATDGKSYFFMSDWQRVSDEAPQILVAPSVLSRTDRSLEHNQCRAASRWKVIGARVVRTDATGKVNWSYNVSELGPVTTPPSVQWLGTENGVKTCYLEVHHPNWVSLDPNGKTLYYSLRYRGIQAIDIASKRVLWQLGGDGDNMLDVLDDPGGGIAEGQHTVTVTRSGELLTFDNRVDPSEVGRAVIYKIDPESGVARHQRSFLPPKDRCTTTSGSVYCPSRHMGNAAFTFDGNVLVNWGDKDGNPNLMTLFDRNGKVLFDLRDETRHTITYKSEFIPKKIAGKALMPIDRVLVWTDDQAVGNLISS